MRLRNMRFRMFTTLEGKEVAINVDAVQGVKVDDGVVVVFFRDQGDCVELKEDFKTVFSRLNTVA